MKKKAFGVILALVLVGALVAGCGQSSSNSSSGNQDYVIGVPEPMTGSYADQGTDMFDAMKLAADQLNKQGGILGHQVKLVEEDDAGDPQTSVNAANKLVSLNVDAVVGQYTSGSALPAEPVYNKAGVPFLLPDANASSLVQQGFNDVFLINVGGETQAQTAADFMVKTLGAKKVIIIDDNSAFAVNLAQLTQKDVIADGGTVASVEAVDPKQVDLSALVSKLKSEKPGAIYFTGYYSQAGLLIKQALAAGLQAKLVMSDGSYDPQLITVAGGKNAEGVYVTATPGPEDLPNAKDFIAQYKTAYNRDPGPYAPDAYDAIMLLNHVITKINSTDKTKVVQALHQTNDYQGLTGTLQFTSAGLREGGTEVVFVVKDGKFVVTPQK